MLHGEDDADDDDADDVALLIRTRTRTRRTHNKFNEKLLSEWKTFNLSLSSH